MLRINSHLMNLDLTKVGFIRQGHVFCQGCGGMHITEISAEIKRHTADVLYRGEALYQNCEGCGAPLVPQVAVTA